MKPARTVKKQDWMTAPETAAVMQALGDGALFVGGCVRNMLSGHEVADIDIATKLTPPEAMARLEAAGIKVVPTGIDHGTVTAVVNKRGFEVTTLRRDVATDGRRAVVAFTEDWAEDAERRDFTINTLLADAQGNIYDPTGKGLADLDARRVVFVGDPVTRIQEDYLRILRFFRFHAIYGKGEPDAEGLAACKAEAAKMTILSRERITQEFFKILAVDDPQEILGIMFENNVLKRSLFPAYEESILKYLSGWQKAYDLPSLSSRLFVLCGMNLKNVSSIGEILLIPRLFQKDMEAFSEVLSMPDMNREQTVRAAVYKTGRTAAGQGLLIELALDRVMNGFAPKALEIIRNWDIPDFPLSGNDLMKEGVAQGPELGRKLSEIEEWWVAGDFKADKKACLAKI